MISYKHVILGIELADLENYSPRKFEGFVIA